LDVLGGEKKEKKEEPTTEFNPRGVGKIVAR